MTFSWLKQLFKNWVQVRFSNHFQIIERKLIVWEYFWLILILSWQWCRWELLETKNDGDKFEMLMTNFAVLIDHSRLLHVCCKHYRTSLSWTIQAIKKISRVYSRLLCNELRLDSITLEPINRRAAKWQKFATKIFILYAGHQQLV